MKRSFENRSTAVLKLLATVVFAPGFAFAQGVVFPSDSGVVDVTRAPYLAIPSDGVDDTAAIQRALNDNPSGNTVFYFPNGVYDLSSTLLPAIDDGVTKRNIFQGQSQGSTVLKLRNNLGFEGAVISFRAGDAQFFRNAVRDLTISIGTGNPNATGLRFNASNQGIVNNVTIFSGDRAGRVGLDLAHSDEIGPALIRNLAVVGFDIGILSQFQTASQTMENITLREQRQVGWRNTGTQTVFARRLTSTNAVTAVVNDGEGRMLLIDSTLNGVGPASTQPAIRNQKAMFLRRVAVSGYQTSVTNDLAAARGNAHDGSGLIIEYWANGVGNSRRGGLFKLFDSPDSSLNLQVLETPVVPWDALTDWKGPQNFGALPNDGLDDTVAIQRAIDSGARTVYLPRGIWNLSGSLVLRGNVRRFLGTEARIVGSGSIQLGPGTEPTVALERLELDARIQLDHRSTRTWVLESLLGGLYASTSPAPVNNLAFLSDVGLSQLRVMRGQRVWARQLNIEQDTQDRAGYEAKVVNDGGAVWILGYKTEDSGTQIKTKNGGRTELLGALHVGRYGTTPRYITQNASFFAALATGPVSSGLPGAAQLSTFEETRAGVTLSGLASGDAYSAFSRQARGASEVIVDNSSIGEVSFTGAWSSTTAFPGGFLGLDALFAPGGSEATIAFAPPIVRDGRYRVFVRWIGDRSGQDHSGHASNAAFQVTHAGGINTVQVNQQANGGHWVSIGDYTFARGAGARITLSAAGANGKVIADSVRLLRL